MIIKRDGKQYELTWNELVQAHNEFQATVWRNEADFYIDSYDYVDLFLKEKGIDKKDILSDFVFLMEQKQETDAYYEDELYSDIVYSVLDDYGYGEWRDEYEEG